MGGVPEETELFTPQVLHPYTYAANNPLEITDPDGRVPKRATQEAILEGAGPVGKAPGGGSPGAGVRAHSVRGGTGPVQTGKAGEAAVRSAVDIGPKAPVQVAGRVRIADGMTNTTLSEVKNVRSLSYTQQLRDFTTIAQQSGREFHLYVRPETKLSTPLIDAMLKGKIHARLIP